MNKMKSLYNNYNNSSFAKVYVVLLMIMAWMMPMKEAWGQDLPFTPTTDENNPILYWLETAGATGFYAVPHSNNTNASTTNAPTLRALWYFMESDESGYYYIINYATGKYLKKTGNPGDDNTIQVANFDSNNKNKFKFSFGAPQGVEDGYWVAYTKEQNANGYGWLSKKSGSLEYGKWLKVSIWGDTPIGDLNSQWKIVPRAAVQWPASELPFRVSTSSSDMHYYRINHAQSTQYNLSYDGSDFVTISNADDRKRVWYFEQVATDPDINNLKYYKIVNAFSGKCLKFTATTINGSNQNDVFKLADYDSTDPFLFVVVDSYGGNAGYSIMPKLAMSKFDVSNYANSMAPADVANNSRVDLRSDRNNNNAHWNFIATEFVNTCDPPVITVTYDGNGEPTNVSISAEEDATIYYTTDGSNPVVPTTGSTTYTASSNPYSFTPGSDVSVIRAVASINPNGSDVSGQAFEFIRYITVSSSDVIINNLNLGLNLGYRLAENFTSNATIGTAETPFRGAIDGDYHSFTLSHALIGVAQDAIIKNVVVSSATVSGSGNVGAIVNTAQGSTKIYNCGVQGGSVSGGTNTGGLVGLIEEGSSVRVVNCYNFADVSGSDFAAGIVGKNAGTVSSTGSVGNVRIALCMMYGNVTGATNISPVYGGNHQDNIQKFTEYNYWRYRSGMVYTTYNDQMAIERDDFLTRFQFYTHILNTHREMAAFFLFGGETTTNVSAINENQIKEIGHWVLKKDVASYPIIEPWQTNTKKVLEAPTPSNILTNMGTNGYLSVTVKIGAEGMSGSSPIQTTISLPITDMDEANYDYTWGKVVLPFANEFRTSSNEVWTPDYTKICTGWKITNVGGETSFSIPSEEPYNFSDRNNKKKDIYDETNNPYIFAQGGNYIVPYGVTAIEITANFAKAFYLRDANYEIAYSGDKNSEPFGYTGRTGIAGGTLSTYHEQPVYNTLLAALSADGMGASGTPHTQAVVLVGNFHMDAENLSSKTGNGFTIMSIDADNNQEPDFAIYSNNTLDRPAIPPTRFDFVAFIPLGMSSHVTNAKFYPNTPIWKPRGWFEITETGLLFANQFEIESDNFNTSEENPSNYRCVINGGYFTQMVRSRANPCKKLKFYQIGGHAYVKEFYPGNHSAESKVNTLVPVNVTGGEVEQCFMTGYGKGTAYGPDIYFWCAGGKIHKFLAAYMEKPRQTENSDGNVNFTAKIDHAIIGRFFGGGTTSTARITGDIKVTINNSKVDFYCGGPEFGDMSANKTVITNATNTIFKEYYGAGFGGTAITYRNDKDNGNVALDATVTYPDYFTTYYVDNTNHKGRLYYLNNYGLGNCYKFEFLMHSRGHRGVARHYTGFASFSLATTGNVTNNLDNCTVLESFYGAGCQGKVNGTVTSTLKDCTVLGSAFGGGYKAAANEVDVYPLTKPLPSSVFTAETGVFSDFGTVEPEKFTWTQGNDEHFNVADDEHKILYTAKENVIKMSDLGNVTGDITITLKGNTTVKGNVFGGGNESKSLSNTLVKILGQTKVFGNIYGGGNMAKVEGNTKVIVNSDN